MISKGEDGNNGKIEIVPEGCVLIVGAGPVGLLLAVVLSSYGVKSILLERNLTTTKYENLVHRSIQQTLDYFSIVGLLFFVDGRKWTSQMLVLWSFSGDWVSQTNSEPKVAEFLSNTDLHSFKQSLIQHVRCSPLYPVHGVDLQRAS